MSDLLDADNGIDANVVTDEKISKMRSSVTKIAEDILMQEGSLSWAEIVTNTGLPNTRESFEYFINEIVVTALKVNQVKEGRDILSCIGLITAKLAYFELTDETVPKKSESNVGMDDIVSSLSVNEKLRTLLEIGCSSFYLFSSILGSHGNVSDETIDEFLEGIEKTKKNYDNTITVLSDDKDFGELIEGFKQEYKLLLEYIAYEIGRTYPTIITPNLWLKIITKASPETKEILMKIPVFWPEEIIQQNTAPGVTKKHRKLDGMNIQVIDGVSKVEETENNSRKRQGYKTESMKRFYRLKFHEKGGKPYFYATMTFTTGHNLDQLYEEVSIVHTITNAQEKHMVAQRSFPQINDFFELDKENGGNWIVGSRAKFLDEKFMKHFKEKFGSTGVESTIQNITGNMTTLTDPFFVLPIDHHRAVINELNCVIGDEDLELGVTKTDSGTDHYATMYKSRDKLYIDKLRFIIDGLRGDLIQNDAGQVIVNLLKNSPYVTLNLIDGKGTIFISDIENYGTQVFSRTVDPEFLKGESEDMVFSLKELGELFGPWTTVQNNSINIEDPASVNAWLVNVSNALSKTGENYFSELQGGEALPTENILRELFGTNAISDENRRTVNNFKQYLDTYNAHLIKDNSKNQSEKKKKALLNLKGASLDVGEAITSLGGNPYFLRYHGHNSIFKHYITSLLAGNIDEAKTLFENFRKEHVVGKSIQEYLIGMKVRNEKITITELDDLFNGNSKEKDFVKEKYNIPRGLFTIASWIIAIGEDPTQNERGETKMDYLIRLLKKEGYLA